MAAPVHTTTPSPIVSATVSAWMARSGQLAPGKTVRPLGTYIEGELGIRLEDVITITKDGAENLTRWSGSPEEPAVV